MAHKNTEILRSFFGFNTVNIKHYNSLTKQARGLNSKRGRGTDDCVCTK